MCAGKRVWTKGNCYFVNFLLIETSRMFCRETQKTGEIDEQLKMKRSSLESCLVKNIEELKDRIIFVMAYAVSFLSPFLLNFICI